MKRFLSLLALALAAALPAVAQPSPPEKPARAEVLVLGVYHMANPGHDVFNTQADDVLAPKRQAEIAQLTVALKKFNPTKIVVEGDVFDTRITKNYADYLAGNHELTRNEIEQIGFRLAKELGHKSVYPEDADGEFPWQRIVDYAKASGRSKELDALLAEVGDMVKAQNAYLLSHNVLETLLYMNADDNPPRTSASTTARRTSASPATGPAPTWWPTGSAVTCASTATWSASPTPRTSASWSSSAPATSAG